jgi:serine/threonine-protein kinase
LGGREEREVIEIPDFVGKNSEEIEDGERFDIELDFAYSESVPEGIVISQTPAASSKKKIAVSNGKSHIKLIVSLGKERAEVPDVVGMKYNSAVAALRKAGFSVRTVPIYRDGVENDVVIKITPNEATALDRGERVTLFVNRVRVVKTVEIADFCGLEQEMACRKILESGLCLRIIECEYSEEYDEGIVISQSIPKGAHIKYGSYIDITVSAGKEPHDESEETNGEVNE